MRAKRIACAGRTYDFFTTFSDRASARTRSSRRQPAPVDHLDRHEPQRRQHQQGGDDRRLVARHAAEERAQQHDDRHAAEGLLYWRREVRRRSNAR